MTEVNFHHGMPDPLAYACRLLWKAHERGAKVAVTGEKDLLDAFDIALWTFEPAAFVPHLRLRNGDALTDRLAPTPVWLVDRAADAPTHEVLVNLGPDVATGFESFERLFEIVGAGDAERQAGRHRWRHYESRGYAISRHEVRA